jgi:hypothetical protein
MGRNVLRVTLFAVIIFAPAAALAKGCTSIQAKCAVEIGGRCDPATGHWEYGTGARIATSARAGWRVPAGGNTLAFNACISRALAKK